MIEERDRSRDSVEMPQQPIVVVASLLALGVVLGWSVWIEWWALVAIGVAVMGCYLYARRWWMALVVVLFAGVVVCMVSRYGEGDVEGVGRYELVVEREANGGRCGVAKIESRVVDGEWQWCGARVRYKETEESEERGLRSGDRVEVWSRVWRYRGRYYMNVSERSVLSVERGGEHGGGVAGWGERVNRWAAARLAKLGLSDEAEGLCGAMLLGRRGALSEERVDEYRRGGAAHILSVSGLHVMIICMIVGQMLMVLHFVPMGFMFRPLLTAAIVWGYAVVVGMTPGVERAAIMFVMMQVLWFVGRSYGSLSGLVVAAALMVLFDTGIVFDVGFMLSVVAVLSILVWVVPSDRALRRVLRRRFGRKSVAGRVVGGVVSVMMVGVACSVATLPLVSWLFGYISPMGVLLNPLVVMTGYLLLLLSFVWVLFGVTPLAPMFRCAIDWVATLQSEAVGYMSSGWRDAVELRVTAWSVVAIYIIYVVVTLVVIWMGRERRERRERREADGRYEELDGDDEDDEGDPAEL